MNAKNHAMRRERSQLALYLVDQQKVARPELGGCRPCSLAGLLSPVRFRTHYCQVHPIHPATYPTSPCAFLPPLDLHFPSSYLVQPNGANRRLTQKPHSRCSESRRLEGNNLVRIRLTHELQF